MPNFIKTPEQLTSHFDRWLYVFKHLWEFEKQPEFIQETILQKLFQIAKVWALNKTEKVAYEESVKISRDLHNSFAYAVETWFEQWLEQWKTEWLHEALQKLIQSWIDELQAKTMLWL
jgi:hypothetical protein